jgi:hypothetical protein
MVRLSLITTSKMYFHSEMLKFLRL